MQFWADGDSAATREDATTPGNASTVHRAANQKPNMELQHLQINMDLAQRFSARKRRITKAQFHFMEDERKLPEHQ